MAKKVTSTAAALHAAHLRKQGLQNEKLANKWDRIARKVSKKEKRNYIK